MENKDLEPEIRNLAYHLWQSAGHEFGRTALDFWEMAERMIVEGRVTVNGRKIASPALDVLPSDKVTVDGKAMEAAQETRLWLYYKPLGLVTSESDEKGRQTVFDALPRELPPGKGVFDTPDHDVAAVDESAERIALARTYFELGDFDTARALLGQVIDEGGIHAAEARRMLEGTGHA